MADQAEVDAINSNEKGFDNSKVHAELKHTSKNDRLPANESEKRKLDSSEESEDIDGKEISDESTQKKQKVSITFGKFIPAKTQERKTPAPITIKLGSKKNEPKPLLTKTSASVASVFNQESDEEEEMPPEARMRMRNIGRDTPTSAGPNSFGKTRQGFCDAKKVFERQLKKKMEEVSDN